MDKFGEGRVIDVSAGFLLLGLRATPRADRLSMAPLLDRLPSLVSLRSRL